METREIGRSGIRIPPLMFGGNVLGWTADKETSFRLLDALLDQGFNAIDTADMYSAWAPGHRGGESEEMIGAWLSHRGCGRDKVVIATKVGMEMGSGGKGLSPAWIQRSVDDSLNRLRSDYIDLYQAHCDDETVPLEETLHAFATLIERGKVRAIGASNYAAPRLREALLVSERLGLPRYECLQPHYNLLERAGYEAELEPLCRSEGLGVIAYFALAAGFLTGKYRSEADLAKSPRGEWNLRKHLADSRSQRVLLALNDVAARRGASPSQAAIAWLVARPSVTAPIASATSLEQLAELVKGAQLRLDREDIHRLDSASA